MALTALLAALGLYANTLYVEEIFPVETSETEICTEIYCTDFNGNIYSFVSEDADWCEGDIVSCIMSSNGTETITDDVIVSVTYSGYIQ